MTTTKVSIKFGTKIGSIRKGDISHENFINVYAFNFTEKNSYKN
jgi:hypothetical protein